VARELPGRRIEFESTPALESLVVFGQVERTSIKVYRRTQGEPWKLVRPAWYGSDCVDGYWLPCWTAGLANVDGEVTKPSVSVFRKATMSSSSSLVKPRLPNWVVLSVAGTSGGGQQVTFSPGEPCAQRGNACEVL
jgi:hypothetical protein